MRKFILVSAMLAFGFAVSATFVSCDDGSTGGGFGGGTGGGSNYDTALNGTWQNNNAEIVLSNGNWNMTSNLVAWDLRGTYTTSGNSITMVITGAYIPSTLASQIGTTEGWKTRSEITELFRRAGYTDAQINQELSNTTGSYSGNIMSLGGTVYTRAGATITLTGTYDDISGTSGFNNITFYSNGSCSLQALNSLTGPRGSYSMSRARIVVTIPRDILGDFILNFTIESLTRLRDENGRTWQKR